MIDRYARPEMARVWSDARRLELWLEVELATTAVRQARGERLREVVVNAREIAAPDHQISSCIDRGDHGLEMMDRCRHVGIHEHDDVAACDEHAGTNVATFARLWPGLDVAGHREAA